MTEPADQQQQGTTTAATTPPKRDKFTSMAAAAAAPAAAAQPQEPAAAEAAPPKRDKFASMAASSQQREHSTPPVATTSVENTQALLKQRMMQRNQVLRDLQQAEGWTWQLLTLASKTARSLATLDMKEDVSSTSKEYRETLQKIHSILSPHASLVVAYENHDVDKNQKNVNEKSVEGKSVEEKKEGVNMYAARVEMRLAQERRDVLKQLLRLEQQEESGDAEAEESTAATAGEKRKRSE